MVTNGAKESWTGLPSLRSRRPENCGRGKVGGRLHLVGKKMKKKGQRRAQRNCASIVGQMDRGASPQRMNFTVAPATVINGVLSELRRLLSTQWGKEDEACSSSGKSSRRVHLVAWLGLGCSEAAAHRGAEVSGDGGLRAR